MEIDSECRKNITKLLTKVIDKKKAVEIEKSIYNYTQDYYNDNSDMPPYLIQSSYEHKSNEIINEINNKNSTYLLNAINEDTIDILKIAYLKPEELNPEKFEPIIKNKELREYKKNNKKGSNIFTCSKCKKANCSVTQKQTRAGDEPPTTFVECLECGHIFKKN
jgi:DNA-directed RNA polymerase subunit M/transcription elongation factor TFIIS